MRGLQRSRTVASLVAEARSLEAQGVKELVLISQDTTRYGEDLGLGRTGLATLVEGASRARRRSPGSDSSTPTRRRCTKAVFDAHGGEAALPPVRRHAAPARLADDPRVHATRRRRGGLPDDLRGDPRNRCPEITLRTTFIVGFPGETEEDFRELREFLEDVRFDNVGVFTYSPEPGSGAEALGDPIPFEEKSSRARRLMELQQKISLSKNRAKRGKVFDALLEGPCSETDLLLEGRLASQAPEIDGRVLVNEVPAGVAPARRRDRPRRGDRGPSVRSRRARRGSGSVPPLDRHPRPLKVRPTSRKGGS